ncbi:MAG: EAL domain-containing protein [Coriobacteriia bacterium]|nr:EAL domain-containing protein [Coriobacteriia bacterium]
MGIRLRTVALLALATLVVWGGLSFVTILYTENSAAQVDRLEVTKALHRAAVAVDYQANELETISGDWAIWDDTYRFVKDQNVAYIKANLSDGALQILGVDFMVFTDRSGQIVYSKAIDPDTSAGSTLPPSIRDYLQTQPDILQSPDSGEAVSGLLSMTDGLYMVVAQSIMTSDKLSSPDGTLIVGYRVGEEETAPLRQLTALPVELFSAKASANPADVTAALSSTSEETSGSVVTIDDEAVVGYAILPGIDGSTGALMRVSQPRIALIVSRSAIIRAELALAVIVLALLGLLTLILDKTVLKRLTNLSSGVRRLASSGVADTRLAVTGKDEIARLAGDINEMLDEIGRSHNELGYLATHDPLTGLHNRRFFEEALERELGERRRLNTEGAVFWFDLDNFKDINDGLGHAAGDELLIAFSAYLREQMREYSVVARLGGDEFGILIPHASREEASAAGSRLSTELANRMFPAGGHEVRVSVSVGAVLYPEHGSTTDDLLSRADLAMYDAKSRGGNEVVFYTADDSWRSEMTQQIEDSGQIVSAIRENGFVLYAQPIFSLVNPSTEAYELLLRMPGKDGEIILPRRFLPAAERLGLIRDIDHWVMRHAIGLLAEERAKGRDVFFTANVSAGAFNDPMLLDIIRQGISESGVEADRLIIEISESSAILNLASAAAFVREIGEIGCRFCLDDFGSGTSSFHYLRHLPIDFVKIDGRIVRDMAPRSTDMHFLRAIVGLCRGLGIRTVAESVESAEALLAVQEQGVDFAQGHHLGRPAPVEEYLEKRHAEDDVAEHVHRFVATAGQGV